MRKSDNYSFGKANDRFHCPTKHRIEPGPTAYTPKAGVNDYLDPNHNTFGRNKFDILSKHFRSNTGIPGPGTYNSYSDFTGLEI